MSKYHLDPPNSKHLQTALCLSALKKYHNPSNPCQLQRVLTDESLDDFNLPLCHPSIDELQEAIEHPPSAFRIEKLDFIEKRPLADKPMEFDDAEAYGKFMAVMFGNMRPMLASHGLSPELTDKFEERYRQNCEKSYAVKKAAGFPMNMSMCVAVLVRK